MNKLAGNPCVKLTFCWPSKSFHVNLTTQTALITALGKVSPSLCDFRRLSVYLKSTQTQGWQKRWENPKWFETIWSFRGSSMFIELLDIGEISACSSDTAHLTCTCTHDPAVTFSVRAGTGLASSSACFSPTISITSSSSTDGSLANWPFSKPKS